MTEDKIEKCLHEILDLINTKPLLCDVDNLYNIYEDYTDNMRYTILEKDEILNKIFTVIHNFHVYAFSIKANIILDLYYVFCAYRIEYKPTNKGRRIKLPSGKEYYIPTSEEKINYIIYMRYELTIQKLNRLASHRGLINENPIKYEKRSKELFDAVNLIQQSKLNKQQAKQEYQKYLSIENTKHNADIYINDDKHSAFEDILEKLKDHKLIDDNNTWIDTKTKFTYFCYVLAQNGFFYGSRYDENKDKYSTPWKDAEKLFHLEKTNSSIVIQAIIKGKTLSKTAKDDIDNILKVYSLTIPTF
jgi:hypothetical protein